MSVQTLEGQSQDGPVHSGSKGRGTVTSASLPILEKLLWARTLEVLGLSVLFMTSCMKYSPSALTLFQIRVNRNGGRCKLQHGNQQPKGCCLEEMPMSPRCPCDEPLHGSWTRWDLVSRKQGSPSVLRFLLEQFYSQQN